MFFRFSSSSGLAPSSSPSTPSCWAAPFPSSKACACWDTASFRWRWPWLCAGSFWSVARGRSASSCDWWWWRRPLAGPPLPPQPSSQTTSRPTARRWWCTRCSSSTLWSGGWSWLSRRRSRREAEGRIWVELTKDEGGSWSERTYKNHQYLPLNEAKWLLNWVFLNLWYTKISRTQVKQWLVPGFRDVLLTLI